jgi:hypothetical protein
MPIMLAAFPSDFNSIWLRLPSALVPPPPLPLLQKHLRCTICEPVS